MLNQLKVIDCSTVLAGPSAGTFFAELGAQVVKIEHPLVPDVTRSWKLSSEDKNSHISAYFASANYKKTFQQLNLSDTQDKARFISLIEDADVLLLNFKKGDDIKFGIQDDYLRQINPKLIIGKISGFGSESDRVAYDLILQAETGFMSMNGDQQSPPTKMPVALIDVLAAHQLKEGILVALYDRTFTQKGSVVEVSLYDAAIASLANQASNYLMENHVPQRIGSLHPNIAPYGEQFVTKDNKRITFAIGSQKHFQLLCEFLKIPNLVSDPRFETNTDRVKNRKELADLLQEKITNLECNTITSVLHPLYVPVGVIRDLSEVFQSTEAQKLVRSEIQDGKMTKRVTQVAFKRKPNGN